MSNPRSWTTLCSLSVLMLSSITGCSHYYGWRDSSSCDECCDMATVMPHEYESIEMPHEVVPSETPDKAPLPAPAPPEAGGLRPFRQISSSRPIVAEPVESQQTLVPNRPRFLTRLKDAIGVSTETNEPAANSTPSATKVESQPVALELSNDAKPAPPTINVAITVLPPQYDGKQGVLQYKAVVSTDGREPVTTYAQQPVAYAQRPEPQKVVSSWNTANTTFNQSGIEMWPHRPVAVSHTVAPRQILSDTLAVDREPEAEKASYTIVPRVVAEPPTAPSLNPLLD